MANTTTIKKLLSQKSWTGRELGILELSNTAVLFRQAKEGSSPAPLIPQDQFRKMVGGLTDPQQLQVYNGYISLHDWIAVRFNIAQTQMQQAQLQYRTITAYVTNAMLGEYIYEYIGNLPIIMTQKQYDETSSGSQSCLSNNRRTDNGIAILDQKSLSKQGKRINDQGYYTEPDILPLLANCTLNAFLGTEKEENTEIIHEARQTLIESYYYILGYNTALKLMSEEFDVPDITVFQTDIEDILERIDELNNLMISLKKKILSIEYNSELKAQKLQIIKRLFQPIGYREIAVPQENIEAAKELFKDFQVFRRQEALDQFSRLLCVLPQADPDGKKG